MNCMISHRIAQICCLVLCLTGCQTPTSQQEILAKQHKLQRSWVNADGYDQLVYMQEMFSNSGLLHVYLEGDGKPWNFRFFPAHDPTANYSFMLQLMTLDKGPAVYLGRPCYNGTASAKGCDPTMWTSGRYSITIVNAMAKAIEKIRAQLGVSKIRLIGHSGGGALAMLIAQHIEVEQVITVAGNLDTDAWTTHHRYTPLYTSLNPAKQPALPPRVSQWHLVGGKDPVVPPSIVRQFIQTQANTLGVQFDKFDHGCCWASIWPRVVDSIRNDKPRLLPGHPFKRLE